MGGSHQIPMVLASRKQGIWRLRHIWVGMRGGHISKYFPAARYESVAGTELELTLSCKISSLCRDAGATEVNLCVCTCVAV